MTDLFRERLEQGARRIPVPEMDPTRAIVRGRALVFHRRVMFTALAAVVITSTIIAASVLDLGSLDRVVVPADHPPASVPILDPDGALGLAERATTFLNGGDLDEAEALARQLLLDAQSESTWDTGNKIHNGHLILGHVYLRRGEVSKAKSQLLLAGQTHGSPQLNSFGPNMSLARDLLREGEEKVVLRYFDLVAVFWYQVEDLDYWEAQIKAGIEPDFGANLVYDGVSPSATSQIPFGVLGSENP